MNEKRTGKCREEVSDDDVSSKAEKQQI